MNHTIRKQNCSNRILTIVEFSWNRTSIRIGFKNLNTTISLKLIGKYVISFFFINFAFCLFLISDFNSYHSSQIIIDFSFIQIETFKNNDIVLLIHCILNCVAFFFIFSCFYIWFKKIEIFSRNFFYFFFFINMLIIIKKF